VALHPVADPGALLPAGAGALLARPVPAGFPSPADDYVEGRISLDAYLVRHKEATFFLRVEGDSMREAGILDGDLLVVDRSVTPRPGHVVIAVVGGDFTVKTLARRPGGGYRLCAAHPEYPDIDILEGDTLALWGVVRFAIHHVAPCDETPTPS